MVRVVLVHVVDEGRKVFGSGGLLLGHIVIAKPEIACKELDFNARCRNG